MPVVKIEIAVAGTTNLNEPVELEKLDDRLIAEDAPPETPLKRADKYTVTGLEEVPAKE